LFEPIANEINWNASRSAIAQKMVELLELHSLLGRELLEILKAARPKRISEITIIEASCNL
jgi:hypothetical protein